MKRILFHFLFISFFCCKGNFCVAQVKFFATASPLEAAKDEYITYKLTIENGEGEAGIYPPSFAGFIKMGPPAKTTFKNKGHSITLTYVLKPKGEGTYTIPACTAKVGAEVYQSNSIQITVTNTTIGSSTQGTTQPNIIEIEEEPKQQKQFNENVITNTDNNVQNKVANNMHFNLQLSKTTCYVGEPVIATYKLFTRLPTESNLEKFPSFNGASVIDMTEDFTNGNYKQENLAGRMYDVYEICKAQLYPLQSGLLTIDAATLNNKVNFAKYDASENGTLLSENVNLFSKPQQLNVLPLPEKNRPENFSGSVGNFTINAQVEKNNFTTTEMGKLIVTIAGSGNMQLLTLPIIQWPSGFEPFEIKMIDNTLASTIPISGNKIFEIPFAIDTAGNYTIPTIGFSFFNPETKTYKTVFSNTIQLSITKGDGKLVKPNVAVANKKANSFSPIKLIGSIVLLLLLGLSYFLFFVKKKKFSNVNLETIKEAQIEKPIFIASEKNYLEKTKHYLDSGNATNFYAALKEEFVHFLVLRYFSTKENMQITTIENTLDIAGVNNNLIIDTKKQMQKIELELYVPFVNNTDLENMYYSTQALVQQHIHNGI